MNANEDECTCDCGSPVQVDCPACEREAHLRALAFLADLVDTFNIIMVVQLRELQAAVWGPR